MNNVISYGWANDLPIGRFVENIHNTILATVSETFKNPMLVDTTWLGSDNISLVYELIQTNKPDVIVLCSLVDATFVTEDEFKQFGTKIISVGNFNKGNRIDFWSMVLNDRHIKQDTTLTDVKYPFLCYNNKPHPHRVQLRNEFTQLGVLDKGAVSFGGQDPVLSPEDPNKIAYEEDGGGNSTLNDTMTFGDIDVWNSSFINIITETEFNSVERCFYSEKTWKPMIGMRPFLHYASNNVNAELNEFGFETFENCFTDICDLDLSTYKNIAVFCKILADQDPLYFIKKYNELKPKLEHNYTNFFKFADAQYKKITNIHI